MDDYPESTEIASLEYYPYRLTPVSPARPEREGFLIKVGWRNVGYGYADVHPWPEFGDLPSAQQLECLAKGDKTQLLENSLRFSAIDASFRSRNLSAFESYPPVATHWSLPELDEKAVSVGPPGGCQSVKVKLDFRSLADLQRLEMLREIVEKWGLSVRLDFNAKWAASDAERVILKVAKFATIDWVEDPCPFQPEVWSEIQKSTGVRLALDFELAEDCPANLPAFQVLIVKPARDVITERDRLAKNYGAKLAFTSSFDHPVGQLSAAWEAAQFIASGGTVAGCGLASHTAYLPNSFSSKLVISGGALQWPTGTGWGFDKELAELKWNPL